MKISEVDIPVHPSISVNPFLSHKDRISHSLGRFSLVCQFITLICFEMSNRYLLPSYAHDYKCFRAYEYMLQSSGCIYIHWSNEVLPAAAFFHRDDNFTIYSNYKAFLKAFWDEQVYKKSRTISHHWSTMAWYIKSPSLWQLPVKITQVTSMSSVTSDFVYSISGARVDPVQPRKNELA